jgi:Mn-dependent DtxR family transcriptional regulator
MANPLERVAQRLLMTHRLLEHLLRGWSGAPAR